MRSILTSLVSTIAFVMACPGIAAEEKPSVPLPAGDVRAKNGYYSVVFYYAPDPAVPTMEKAKRLVAQYLPGVKFVNEPDKFPAAPFVGMHEEKAPLKDFAIPGDDYFQFAGRGLTQDDIAAFRQTTVATSLFLVSPKDDVWINTERFTALAHEYATVTKGYLWDSSTRECFTRDEWKKRRMTDWKAGAIPEISRHTTIHQYRSDDTTGYVREITLGMEKFARPDIVIEQIPPSENRSAGNLINLVCQSFAEQPVIADPMKHVVRLAEIKNEALRASHKGTLYDNATGEITLALVNARRDEGDPENRLVEIDFRNASGRTNTERQNNALSGLWGSKDSLTKVKHDDELLAASERAKQRLPELHKLFAKGLEPGVQLLLKAPFQRDDEGNEWMWVEVMQWPDGGKVTGILQNDPYYIKLLRAGSKVVIKESEVFDYILYLKNGTSEGNETGKIMERRESETITK